MTGVCLEYLTFRFPKFCNEDLVSLLDNKEIATNTSKFSYYKIKVLLVSQ